MPTNSFQLSPANAEARYQSLQFRLRFDPKSDDPLFRPIDADDFRIHGASASDFTTLRRNGLIRIILPLPANVRLIDPVTNLPSAETFVDVWRAVPSVNNVALTGPDGHVFVARGPNPGGRIPTGRSHHDAPGSSASAPSSTTPRCRGRPHATHAGRSRRVPAHPVQQSRCGERSPRPSPRASRRCPTPTRLSPRSSSRAKPFSSGRARMSWRPRAIDHLAADRRPVSRHRDDLSASGRHRLSAALCLRGMSRRNLG